MQKENVESPPFQPTEKSSSCSCESFKATLASITLVSFIERKCRHKSSHYDQSLAKLSDDKHIRVSNNLEASRTPWQCYRGTNHRGQGQLSLVSCLQQLRIHYRALRKEGAHLVLGAHDVCLSWACSLHPAGQKLGPGCDGSRALRIYHI